ncbi:MAG: hemerythrin domain-containing protein [Candidatus Binatia bacterium]
MSRLVDELKREHQALVAILDDIRSVGIGTKEGLAKLNAAKSSFLAHLRKEDEQLYPPLRTAATTQAALHKVLDQFAKDMDDVSKAALEFFEKYAQGGNGLEFARDFGKLFAALGARIRREETKLYQEFENLEID